jgi:hypothetical protein
VRPSAPTCRVSCRARSSRRRRFSRPHRRTLGVVALRAALQSGYDEGSERGWTRTAEAQDALAAHGASERAHGVLTALYGSLTAPA